MKTYLKAAVPDVIRITDFVSIYRQHIEDRQINGQGESHDFWEFLFLESGRLRILVDGELYILSAGDLILYPPHAFHTVAMSSNTTACNVSFYTESPLLFELASRVSVLSESAQEDLKKIISLGKSVLVHPLELATHDSRYRNNVPPADAQRLANRLEMFLLDLCNTETRSNTKNFRDELFATFTDYLKSNMDQSLSLEDMSEGCSASVSQLQKLCRKYCGCGPNTYFISLKIGAAKQMMKDSTLNITQIAESLGFSSVHYFSKLFKSKTGMTPSEFAKSAYKS